MTNAGKESKVEKNLLWMYTIELNKDELIFYAQSLYRQELLHDSLFKTFQPHFDVGLDEFIGLKMFSSSLFLSREFIEGSDVFVTLLAQPQPKKI